MTEPEIVEYTDRSVLDGIAADADWADPTMNPEEIDWARRLEEAAIPFTILNGRPVKPGPPTGIRYGRNMLGHWGEKQCGDVLAVYTDPLGRRWILLIKRGDKLGWAMPGGGLEPGETAREGAARELGEEAGINVVPDDLVQLGNPLIVPEVRGSDESWIVTTVFRLDLAGERFPNLYAGTDADEAAWLLAPTYDKMIEFLEYHHGDTIFESHRQILRDLLDGPR